MTFDKLKIGDLFRGPTTYVPEAVYRKTSKRRCRIVLLYGRRPRACHEGVWPLEHSVEVVSKVVLPVIDLDKRPEESGLEELS